MRICNLELPIDTPIINFKLQIPNASRSRQPSFFMPVPLSSLVRRTSKISGWGVYTRAAISKNTRIIDYAGEKISHAESLRREKRQLARGEVWCFTVDKKWVRDASVGGNLARFINHTCTPNCYAQVIGDVIWIRAARNIKAGEELSYNYRTDGEATIQCRCRPGCKTLL